MLSDFPRLVNVIEELSEFIVIRYAPESSVITRYLLSAAVDFLRRIGVIDDVRFVALLLVAPDAV